MKQYTSLWLVCLLAVFSMTARAQEGIETKARPDYPALPFMLTFEAPAEGSASLSISADGETLTSPTTLHSGTEVTITVTPADGYRMASGYPKVYRTGTPSETVPATFKPDASSGIAYLYTFTMPDFPVTVEVEYEKIQSTVTFANPANGTLTFLGDRRCSGEFDCFRRRGRLRYEGDDCRHPQQRLPNGVRLLEGIREGRG